MSLIDRLRERRIVQWSLAYRRVREVRDPGRASTPVRGAVVARVALLALLAAPLGVRAQTRAVVEGRVVEFGTGLGIENAGIVIEGQGATLSRSGGAFRFEGVSLGPQVLSVRALGYAPLTLQIVVEGDMDVSVYLEIEPLRLDSLVVEPTSVEIAGRVRDPELDIPLVGADVYADRGDPALTNLNGRFDLDAWEGVPLRITVRAFGYLPLDTTVVPIHGAEYRFDLSADPLVTRMIETEIARLEERSAGRRSALLRPLGRVELLRWKNASLAEALRAAYSIHLRRVRCVVFDEKQLHSSMIGPTLRATFVEELERIEFLFRGAMLRVYTRDFMRRMIGGGVPLRAPSYASFPPSEPLCT